MTDKTMWEIETDEAESGHPNSHYFDDVRYLTDIVSELLGIIEDNIGSDFIKEDLSGRIAWFFAKPDETKKANNDDQIKKCNCDPKQLLNFGCACGGI